MTLTQKLDDVMRELSLLPNTRSTYHGWVRAFYRFNGLPASLNIYCNEKPHTATHRG